MLVGSDAEDVASETWLQIARNLRSFDTGGGDGFRRGLEETIAWFSQPANLGRYSPDRYVL